MRFIEINPDDARWLRYWLRNNVIGFLTIAGFLLVLRAETGDPTGPSYDRAEIPSVAIHQPTTGMQNPIAVLPQGWRRTSRGWEHVSTWKPSLPPMTTLNTGATAPVTAPTWIDGLLDRIQGVPPLIFALVQITAIAAIVNMTKKSSRG